MTEGGGWKEEQYGEGWLERGRKRGRNCMVQRTAYGKEQALT